MNNIILEKHTLPVLKSEKLLKRNKLLTIQNINKDFELENSKEYKSITSNLHEDYARIQFKEILTEAIHKGASDIHIEPCCHSSFQGDRGSSALEEAFLNGEHQSSRYCHQNWRPSHPNVRFLILLLAVF